MMKKKYIFIAVATLTIIILISLLLFTDVFLFSEIFEPKLDLNNDYLKVSEDVNFEYYEKINLSEIVTIENGNIEEDLTLDTTKLGNHTIEFSYTYDNKKYKGTVDYTVEDTTPPLILNSGTYTFEAGNERDILATTLCADNYDSDIKCFIEGTYDINKTGLYNVTINAIDTSGNKTVKNVNFSVIDEFPIYPDYVPEPIYLEDIIDEHKNENTRIGIDVSHWQDDIDWEQVKNAGIEFAFIRIGYGLDEGEHVFDRKFHRNMEEATKYGIDIGIYYYSYAESIDDAVNQAKWIVENIKDYNVTMPIAYDWEEWSDYNSYNLSLTEFNNMAKAFMDEIIASGYDAMNYSSKSKLYDIWNLPEYDTWLAHYTDQTDYTGDYYIWQLTHEGIVPGIEGFADLNVLYK